MIEREITRKIKKILAAGILSASLLAPAGSYAQEVQVVQPKTEIVEVKQENQTKQVSGSIETIVSKEDKMSYPRLNLSYELPGKVSGYTFMEFYTDGSGFFGKSTLSRHIGKGVSSAVQVRHINEPVTDIGFGAKASLPMPQKSYASVSVFPAWVDKNGGFEKNRVTVGYAIGTNLGSGFSISSFGEANLASKGGPTWGYGELKIAKAIGKHYEASYIPAIKANAAGKPYLEHRVGMEIKF